MPKKSLWFYSNFFEQSILCWEFSRKLAFYFYRDFCKRPWLCLPNVVSLVSCAVDITSGYFGVESLLLGACFGATAASFYFQPSSQTARKLFFASLLYLPVFMTAMICHRIPSPILKNKELSEKSQQGLQVTQIGGESRLLIRDSIERKKPYYGGHMPVRPPIAFLSAAPFPFLPPPDDRTSLL